MRDISPETMMAIEWGLVPLILVGILAHFLIYTPGKNMADKIKISSTAGKFAGLLLFALFILSQKGRELSFAFTMPAYDFNYVIVLASVGSGIVFSLLFKLMKENVFIGLYTLSSVAITSVGIYTYLFIENYRSYLVFVTMGVMLGVLIFTIFFPKELAIPRKSVQPD